MRLRFQAEVSGQPVVPDLVKVDPMVAGSAEITGKTTIDHIMGLPHQGAAVFILIMTKSSLWSGLFITLKVSSI